jgi:post-segregation antitoxin (ccd killing protein)
VGAARTATFAKVEWDENGWAVGAISELTAPAWLILSPEPDARVDAARWAHQAATFFKLELEVLTTKRYPSGAVPLADVLDVAIGRAPEPLATVRIVTVPIERVPEARRRGLDAAAAIGGAGMDALVLRARRLWQIEDVEDRPEAALAVAAVLASVLLGPIVPPSGDAIFGVKGAREWLARMGFRA